MANSQAGRMGGLVAASALLGVALATGAATAVANAAANSSAAASTTTVSASTYDSAAAAAVARERDIYDLQVEMSKSPDRYGGSTAAGSQQVQYCDLGSGSDPAIDAIVDRLRSNGTNVVRTACEHSLARLNDALLRVPASSIFKDSGVTLLAWGLDYRANVLNVGVSTINDAIRERINDTFSDVVHLYVTKPLQALAGRTSDAAPFRGGDRIDILNSFGYCTSGFAAHTSSNASYSITAGHCFPLYYEVRNVGDTGNLFGTVTHRAVNSHDVDAALISNQSYRTSVFTGPISSTTTLPVVGRTTISYAGDVYFDGSVTGQAHGFVQDSASSCQTIDSRILCGLREAYGNQAQDLCAHGDSGGPVFKNSGSGVLAVGIITARVVPDQDADETPTPDCWYTEIKPILSRWSLEISTGSP